MILYFIDTKHIMRILKASKSKLSFGADQALSLNISTTFAFNSYPAKTTVCRQKYGLTPSDVNFF